MSNTSSLTLFILVGLLAAGATTTSAEINPAAIAVPALGTDGRASLYPSSVSVTSILGPNVPVKFSVVLHGVTHPCPEELAVLVVHEPANGATPRPYLLMSNAGGCQPLEGTHVAIEQGAMPLPDAPMSTTPHGGFLSIGPSTYGTAPAFPTPAPAGPYAALPAATNVNGTWRLFVWDTGGAGRGVVVGGWGISFSQDVDVTWQAPPREGKLEPIFYPIAVDLANLGPDLKVDGQMECEITLVHLRPSDLRIVLTSPFGTSVVLMANAGGTTAFSGNLTFRFDHEALTPVPQNTIAPTFYEAGGAYGTDVGLDGMAPAPPFNSSLNAFEREPIAGQWKVWTYDAAAARPSGAVKAVRLRFPYDRVRMSLAPVPATSKQPFVRVEARATARYSNRGAAGASWRVVNGDAFYAAGAFTVRPDSTSLYADVPVKKGVNHIQTVLGDALMDTVLGGAAPTVTVTDFSYVLAEGATGPFFDLDVTLANTGTTAAPITLDFLREEASPVGLARTVRTDAPLQVAVDAVVPSGAVSTVVRSTNAVPLVVERTMSWDATGYGGHGDGASAPATRWLFAEGAQGFFSTYVLLANDNADAADVTVTFLLEGGGVVTHTTTVPAHARVTVDASRVSGVVNRSFGIDVTSSAPIIAERAMYFSEKTDRTFDGGHESAGVNATSPRWFLAEGATGPFFDCFVLLSNPNPSPARVTLTYLLPEGAPIVRTLTMAANSRETINVETVDDRLLNAAVSTLVSADIGIVAERAMYWPSFSEGWREAHNSFGVTDTGLRWGIADGRLGGTRGHETYILLANPNATAAEVQVRFLKAGLNKTVTRQYTLAPTSRLTIQGSELLSDLGEGLFSAEIQVLNYQPIAVEKAMYWNASGVTWAAGTNVTATRLPPQ